MQDHVASGAQRVLRRLAYPLARRAARPYVVGTRLDDATRVCRRFEREGILASIGYWNHDEDAPGEVLEQCLRTVRDAAGLTGRPYVSIKAPALGFRGDLVQELSQAAARARVRLHFDSHGPDTVERTFALVAAARRVHSEVGCTLPGRWTRSEEDAGWAAGSDVFVRVVKGQWSETGAAAREPRAGFLAVVDRLAGRARHVAVATHDDWLAARAVERLQAAGTPCEIEMLYGLPMRAVRDVARRLGVRTRIYMPYGEALLPYAVRYVRQNPRIVWWLLKDVWRRPESSVSR